MKHCPVIFIACKGFDNLGIGYMQSVLSAAGHKSCVLDLARNRNYILNRIKDLNPVVIGFSVIFHENLERYSNLVSYLRREGIRCHFTAGGHFASLEYRELFELVPGLDSIVRFEGEYTMLELVNSLCECSEWKSIDGLAYVDDGKAVSNKLRPFEKELDRFPYPFRQPSGAFAFDRKFATMLAGRGCVHNCSFCNSRKFYAHDKGALKRLRKPECVVEEMVQLFDEKGCSIFLFIDDDFPVRTRNGSDWITKFCNELKNKGLSGKILWKICCRTDEIDEDLFILMKKNGFFMIFIGIEEGTDYGLRMMNKGVTAAQNLKGIRILQKLGIAIDFGFMIFHPSTTFRSFNENLSFLRESFAEGYDPVAVTKMIPSYETRIEHNLRKEGRLKVSAYTSDYDFQDSSMGEFYDFVSVTFSDWSNHPYGVVSMARQARNSYLVFFQHSGKHRQIMSLYRKLKKTISEANLFYLNTLEELSEVFEKGQNLAGDGKLIEKYRKKIDRKYYLYRRGIIDNIDAFMLWSLVFYNPTF
jgi:anaerobic magnesium-protoporphyrin IX monomethyl ester cyclase